MTCLITQDGQNKSITEQQASHLTGLALIFQCPECSAEGRAIYHIYGGASDSEHGWTRVNLALSGVSNQTP